MAAKDVTKKLLIYHTLYRLNLSFSNIIRRCYTLQDAGVFKLKDRELFEGYAQELQSEINETVLDLMHSEELKDWARFGKVRQRREKDLHDPDDAPAQLEEHRRKRRK